VRQPRPSANGSGAKGGPREGACLAFPGGRRLDLDKTGLIDVRPVEPRSKVAERNAPAFRSFTGEMAPEGTSGKATGSRKSSGASRAARERERDAPCPEAGDVPLST
jgi:hypothetical protein